MQSSHISLRDWFERIILAIFFSGFGLLIFAVFSPIRPMLIREPTNDYLGRIGLTLFLLILGQGCRRFKSLEKFKEIIDGLTIMIIAVSLDYFLTMYFLTQLPITNKTPSGFALQKLNECFVVVTTIIVLTKLSGKSLGSIYIQKGKLKLGLIMGGISFLVAVAISIPLANFQFQGNSLTVNKVIAWAPWLLILALSNGAQEELLFRGLFLRKLEPFYGKFISNALVVFVFTFLHLGATYSSDQRIFILALVPLALAWGWMMQKTEGVWASILFHAGMDIPIFIGLLSNL